MIGAENCVAGPRNRLRVAGKFLFLGTEKFYVRGVTYGPFRPGASGEEYEPRLVDRDFAAMAKCGINAVRTYNVPPAWLLDAAAAHGLRVMAGIPWEQHVTFLDDPARVAGIEERVRAAVRRCAGHPAILCYVVGNEIPSSVVRWHGARRIETFLERLYRAAKQEDPEALVTYVNYPSTEYLNLSFLDVVAFNVYLESRQSWESYLARLQNLTGDRPLVLAEIGLDSRRNGEDAQARTLDWLIRGTFAKGCAGAFVFAWTDEWHRGGHEIDDWDFGLTRRDRTQKPALDAVRRAFSEAPLPATACWPRVSVVVCTYNGHRTMGDTLRGLAGLRYPDLEVIVVDDGSSPSMEPVVAEFGFRVIRTPNQGLSAARNVGMEAASGDIVAYIDDDAYPDPDWLTYLASVFCSTSHVGIGGPNIPPPGDGRIADCVANAPGGPVHVLLSDEVAEHIPGCNMAFRREALMAIGGFDPRFRVAGDDVDLCWRFEAGGGTLGFCPGAVVWHHRRNSIRTYWKQQAGYGRAEALLADKWPKKYNRAGYLSWAGRIYGRGLVHTLGLVSRIYHGTWGSAPFQSLYQTGPNGLLSLLAMPEWYLLLGGLGVLAALASHSHWYPYAAAAFVLAAMVPVFQAWRSSRGATWTIPPRSRAERLGLRMCTAFLYLLQPVARLWGRTRHGISPWRRRGAGFSIPCVRSHQIWSEAWISPQQMLARLEQSVRKSGVPTLRSGIFDRWDLEVTGGMLGSCRVQMAVEEHGSGRQLFRFRSQPNFPRLVFASVVVLTICALIAWLSHADLVCGFLGISAGWLAFHAVRQCGTALAVVSHAIRGCRDNAAAIPSQSRVLAGLRHEMERAR